MDAEDGLVPCRRLFAAADGHLVSFSLPDKIAELTIGRSPEVDISIDHPSVSRKHTMLRGGTRLIVEDIGSSNGTWVRNLKLEEGERQGIVAGEVIRLGDVSVWVEQKGGERPSEESGRQMKVSGVPVVVEDGAMKSLYQLVERVAKGTINVLLRGETGVGKEVVARAIHFCSERGAKEFVGINCAAFSETLLESELFGHERGAFTGAAKAKPGLLETAHGGTILLDEVGELSLASQAKLLRALEERRILRLGSLRSRPIDVRFLSATNRDLEQEVESGRFRRDLYYRLNGVTLEIPPLRERKVEIEPLARRYVRLFAAKLGRASPAIEPATLDLLRDHSWPGNIRELRNVIERAVLLCADEPIGPHHLLVHDNAHKHDSRRFELETSHDDLPLKKRRTRRAKKKSSGSGSVNLKEEMERMERQKVLDALEACGGNQSRTAKKLGISRNTLIRKLDRYGVPRPRKGK